MAGSQNELFRIRYAGSEYDGSNAEGKIDAAGSQTWRFHPWWYFVSDDNDSERYSSAALRFYDVGGVTETENATADSALARMNNGTSWWQETHLVDVPVPNRINAAADDKTVDLVPETGDRLVVALRAPGTAGTQLVDGRSTWLFPAGGMLYELDGSNPAACLMQVACADSSWSYAGPFGGDSSSSAQKQFSSTDAELALYRVLGVLGLDTDVLIDVCFAYEPGTAAEIQADVEQLIDGWRAAAAAIGHTGTLHVQIVCPHAHSIGGSGSVSAADVAQCELNRDAIADAVAGYPSGVGLVDVLGATESTVFDGSAEAVDWLNANGYADVATATGGDMLDASRLHPKDGNAGRFFARVKWSEMGG